MNILEKFNCIIMRYWYAMIIHHHSKKFNSFERTILIIFYAVYGTNILYSKVFCFASFAAAGIADERIRNSVERFFQFFGI